MKHPWFFLRRNSIVPDDLPFAMRDQFDEWEPLEVQTYTEMDLAIPPLGWQFMRIGTTAFRVAIGSTHTLALGKAVSSALNELETRFNVAELVRSKVTKYACFYVAQATVEAGYLQECSSRGVVLTKSCFAPSRNPVSGRVCYIKQKVRTFAPKEEKDE